MRSGVDDPYECQNCGEVEMHYVETTTTKPYIETWECGRCKKTECWHVAGPRFQARLLNMCDAAVSKLHLNYGTNVKIAKAAYLSGFVDGIRESEKTREELFNIEETENG